MRNAAASEVTPGVDPRILDQLRRVRWRRRIGEAQRVVYPVVAVAAVAAAAVTVAALRAGTAVFAVTLAGAATAVAVTAAIVVRRAWRRRLPADRLAVWVDDEARLGGALATLISVRRATPLGALLAARNLTALRVWVPERVVRSTVPIGAAVAAATGIVLLVLALATAPLLLPVVPEVVTSEMPLAAVDARGFTRRSDRVVVGPDGMGPRGGDGIQDGRATPAAADTGAERGTMSWPAVLQERLRRDLWGRDWDRVQEALARAAASTARTEPHRSSARRAARPGSGDARDVRENADTSVPAGSGGTEEQLATQPGRTGDGDGSSGSGRGAGAGSGSDPNLFGAASGDVHAGADPFALAIAARVRARPSTPRPPSGDAPPEAPDTHPELARKPRHDDPMHRMPPPPAYEALVRALFTREDAGR